MNEDAKSEESIEENNESFYNEIFYDAVEDETFIPSKQAIMKQTPMAPALEVCHKYSEEV